MCYENRNMVRLLHTRSFTQKTISKVGRVNLKPPAEINNGEDDWSELSLIKTFQ